MSTDNRTMLNDCEANTGWTGDDSATVVNNAGEYYEGSNGLSTQLGENPEEMYTTQDSVGMGTFNIDLSDSTVYWIVKDNLGEPYSAGGMGVIIGDGTDRVGYYAGGNDAVGCPLATFFNSYKFDVSVVVATPGTDWVAQAGSEANLAQTAVTEIGIQTHHLDKANGPSDNVFMDAFRYIANDSYALTINGGTSGTPETMADVAGDDVTNGWGLVGNPVGEIYYFNGPTEWGTPSGTANTYFTATDEQWILLGDNGGGHAVGANHFPMRLIGNSTGTNSFVITRVVLIQSGTRAQFDMSNADMDTVQVEGCSFNDLGALTFPTQVANDKYVNDSTFNNCDQVDFQSCDADGCTFNGTTDADGAIIWDENTSDVSNQDNFTFNSDGTGNAIEIAPTGAGPFTYNVTGYNFDGYAGQSGTAANRIFYINPSTLSADININLTGGSITNIQGGGDGKSWREVGSYTGTVTISTSVDVNITVVDESNTAIQNVQVSVYLTSDDTQVMNELTNASGLATEAFTGTTPADVYVRARKSSTGSTRYFNASTTATIGTGGLDLTIVMRTDNIASA